MTGRTPSSRVAGANSAPGAQATRTDVEDCDPVQYLKMRDALVSGTLNTRPAAPLQETPAGKRQSKATKAVLAQVKSEAAQDLSGEAHSESQTPTKRVRRQRGGVALPTSPASANPANSTTPSHKASAAQPVPAPPPPAPTAHLDPDAGQQGAEEGTGNATMASLATLMAMHEVNQALMDAGMGAPAQEGQDWMAGTSAMGDGGTSMGPSSDNDPTRARVRREKNRVAARKCRAKKVQFMAKMQAELKDLMAQNNEIKNQVVTWHRMFTREVKLREAMKRLIQAVWGSTAVAAATGHSANDVLLGLEAGTLDINTLMTSSHNDVQTLPHLTDPNTGMVMSPRRTAGLLPGTSPTFLPHTPLPGIPLHLPLQPPTMFASLGEQGDLGAGAAGAGNCSSGQNVQSPHLASNNTPTMRAAVMQDMTAVVGSPGASTTGTQALCLGMGQLQHNKASTMTALPDMGPSGPPVKKRCTVELASDDSGHASRGGTIDRNTGGSPVGDQAPSFASKSGMQHSPFAAACGAATGAGHLKDGEIAVVQSGNVPVEYQPQGSPSSGNLHQETTQLTSPQHASTPPPTASALQHALHNGPMRLPPIHGCTLPSASASLEALLNTLTGAASLSTPGGGAMHIPNLTNSGPSSLLASSILAGTGVGSMSGLPCVPDVDTDMAMYGMGDVQRPGWSTPPCPQGLLGMGQTVSSQVAHLSSYTYNNSAGSTNSEGTRLATSQLAGAQQVADRFLQKGDSLLSRDCATPATTSSALNGGRRSSLSNPDAFMRSQPGTGHASDELIGCLAAGGHAMSMSRIGSLDWLADLLTMSSQQQMAPYAPSKGPHSVARQVEAVVEVAEAGGDV